MKTKKILFLFIVTICFVACKDEEAIRLVPDDYHYFPLEIGSWIVYDVDSTVHLDIDDQTNQPDTSIAYYHYQLKETIDSSFIDGQGDTASRILREIRMSDTLPWNFLNIWTCKRNANSAQRIEDNIRFVKLSFPISSGVSWNGNAFNTLPGEEYMFEEVHQRLAVGPYVFDSTVTVNQEEFISLINRIVRKEKYARMVGMVSRQRDSLNINGLGETINGVEFRQTVNSYGR
jgi:hypothetical protein